MHKPTLKQDVTGRYPQSLSQELAGAAAQSRRFLERKSRAEIARFILRQRTPDGGFKGRGADSDLYYTVFAAAGLKALSRPVPARGLWNYVRRFGDGEGLDLVHLCCLLRLRAVFPMFNKTRARFYRTLQMKNTASAYDFFLKRMAEEDLGTAGSSPEPLRIPLTDPTPNLAAAAVVSRQADTMVIQTLFSRVSASGGFCATGQTQSADLLSTAVALFALRRLNADLTPVRRPCLTFIESLWRDSGGFAGCPSDPFADVEYTFYALLAIGCLL